MLYILNSLKNKLLLALIIVGFIPLLILLSYTVFFAKTNLIQQTIKEQEVESIMSVKLIHEHLQTIQNQVTTLASLEVMNDLITNDLDKRISKLLFKQVRGLQEHIDIFTVKHGTIIASSNLSFYQKKFPYTHLLTDKDGTFIQNNALYFYTTIISSFDSKKTLGILILKYDLKNLKKFLLQKENTHSYIQRSFTQKKLNFEESNLVIRQPLGKPLESYDVVYNVNQEKILSFINHFITILFLLSLLILALIIFLSFKLSQSIITPIEKFTKTTDYIVQTQDYSIKIEHTSSKELTKLSNSFNHMLATTLTSLEKLETENKLRLQRLTQLIQTFNEIVNTNTETMCIEHSIDALRKITHASVDFQKNEVKDGFHLYVTDFKKKTKLYYGSLIVHVQKIHTIQEREFYNAIASMIALQIDRIRLIANIESASKSKSAFISNMSHELRTPLNSIIGSTQYLLTYEDLNATSLQTVATIESSAHYLLTMINDILDIAKIEAGKMEVNLTTCNIKQIVMQAFEILSPLAREKNLLIHLDTIQYTAPLIDSDTQILQQIIMNLLSNAIKFTQEGSITVKLYNDSESVTIAIEDTGIGITKENLESIFEEFTQVQNVMQKQYKGTGIGLSLSQKMAHLINGNITLESDGITKGTTAKLILFTHL